MMAVLVNTRISRLFSISAITVVILAYVQSGASSLPVMGSHHAMDSGELSRDYFYEQPFRGP